MSSGPTRSARRSSLRPGTDGMISSEDWKKAVAVRKMKRNLAVRQRKLLSKLRAGRARFRADKTLQVELRRVASRCMKLGERLNGELADEVVADVMTS